jgi:pilus assembly protein Flp/PilA
VFKSLQIMLRNDDAQGLVEYGLIIALVAIVAIVALKLLGGKLNNTLNNAANQLGP